MTAQEWERVKEAATALVEGIAWAMRPVIQWFRLQTYIAEKQRRERRIKQLAQRKERSQRKRWKHWRRRK